MKQIPLFAGVLILFSLPGCVPGAPPPPNANLLPMEYMHAASALAVDDVDKARESLIALAKAGSGDLQTRAQAAAGTADIEAMRESFKTLTEEVAVNMSYPDEYAVAFCPKYKDGSKWIQKREAPIANPYFGKSMQTCGSFVD